MSEVDQPERIIRFPKGDSKKPSSTERIWGKPVLSHGYTAIPSILIQAQSRLGITPLQMNIIIQLLDYWREPERRPFPTKKDIASRIGVTDKTIQTNIRQLEHAGLIRRQLRKTASGDWNSNIYHLDGLVARIAQLEPEFTNAREVRRESGARKRPWGDAKPDFRAKNYPGRMPEAETVSGVSEYEYTPSGDGKQETLGG